MRKNQIIPGLLLCGIAALLLPAFRQAQDQNVILCASYMRYNIASLSYYAVDWDETYPTWTSDSNLDSRLRPYQTSFTYMFACPATHQDFLFNTGLKALSLTSFADYSTVEFLRDASSHPDGLISIGYADGRVLHGGVFVGDTSRQCIENARRLAIDLNLYAIDYDNVLPPVFTPVRLQGLLQPYTRESSVSYCPDTGLIYLPNTALSSTNMYQYSDKSSVWAIRDSVPHRADGIITTAFLDGHVERPGWPQFPLDGDDNKQCIVNQRAITRGVLLYAQDYDGILPDLTDSKHTMSLLSSYFLNYRNIRIHSSLTFDWNFICPQTGLQYIFNASLSNQSLSSFANLDSYWVITDASPHPDGQKTTSFLSGAVQHPGYVNHANNALQCVSSVKDDIGSIRMYALDYDEVLPPMHSSFEYGQAIAPYQLIKNELICPELNLPYLPTSVLSGVSLGAIPDGRNTIILQDPRRHPDGRTTLGYVDGHVSKKYLLGSGVGGIRRNAGGGSRRNTPGRPTWYH